MFAPTLSTCGGHCFEMGFLYAGSIVVHPTARALPGVPASVASCMPSAAATEKAPLMVLLSAAVRNVP